MRRSAAGLKSARRPAVVAATHHQPTLGQAVPVEPVPGEHPVVLVAPGQVDDPVTRRRVLLCQGDPVRERSVVVHGGEEGVPVLGLALDEAQPVPHVGDHAVDVEHDDGRTVVVHGVRHPREATPVGWPHGSRPDARPCPVPRDGPDGVHARDRVRGARRAALHDAAPGRGALSQPRRRPARRRDVDPRRVRLGRPGLRELRRPHGRRDAVPGRGDHPLPQGRDRSGDGDGDPRCRGGRRRRDAASRASAPSSRWRSSSAPGRARTVSSRAR